MGKACQHCLRAIVVIFNLLFVLIGLAIVGLALYLYLEPKAQHLTEATGQLQNIKIILFVLMGLGGFTVIVGGMGCCGAYFESPCALGTYFSLVFLILAAEVAAGVLGFMFRDELQRKIEETMRKGVNNISNESPNKKTAFMDTVQTLAKCCGVQGPNDYCKTPTDSGTCTIPVSCCANKEDCKKPTDAFQKGCKPQYISYFETHWQTIFIVIITIAGIELFGLIFSLILCCLVRGENAGYIDVDHNGD